MATTGLSDTMYAGNMRVFEFTVIDADDPTPNTPLDLSSYTIKWALSRTDEDGNYRTTPVLEKSTTGGGISKTDPTNGICEVTVVGADTASLAAGLYYFELEVYDVSSESLVVSTGELTILANVVNS